MPGGRQCNLAPLALESWPPEREGRAQVNTSGKKWAGVPLGNNRYYPKDRANEILKDVSLLSIMRVPLKTELHQASGSQFSAQMLTLIRSHLITTRHITNKQPLGTYLWCTHACLVTLPFLTLSHPMDCSPPGSSVHISQARILEWVAISFSRGSSPSRDEI